MKYIRLIKSVFMALALLMAVGCDVDSSATNPSPDFAQLEDDGSVSILENGGDVVEIVVLLGGPQSTDTSIVLDVTGDASRYELSASSFTIPAGETSATATFTAIDDDDINGDVSVVITLSTASSVRVGLVGQGPEVTDEQISKTITIVDDNVPCNDYVLTVLTDAFPQETTWEITDIDGAVVYSGGEDYGPPSSAESRLKEYVHLVPLEDGCYTFTIYDVFCDGLSDGVVEGSWNLACGAAVASSGSGNFGCSDSTEFCVNQ